MRVLYSSQQVGEVAGISEYVCFGVGIRAVPRCTMYVIVGVREASLFVERGSGSMRSGKYVASF